MAKVLSLNCAFGLGNFNPSTNGWTLKSAPSGYSGLINVGSNLTQTPNTAQSPSNPYVDTFDIDTVSPSLVIPGDYIFEYFNNSGAGCGQQYKLTINPAITLSSPVPVSITSCNINGTVINVGLPINLNLTYPGAWTATTGVLPSGVTGVTITPTSGTTSGTIAITGVSLSPNTSLDVSQLSVPIVVTRTSNANTSCLQSGSVTCDTSQNFNILRVPEIYAGPDATTSICYSSNGLDLHRNANFFNNNGVNTGCIPATSCRVGPSTLNDTCTPNSNAFLSSNTANLFTRTMTGSYRIEVWYEYSTNNGSTWSIIGGYQLPNGILATGSGTASSTNPVNFIFPNPAITTYLIRRIVYIKNSANTVLCSDEAITTVNLSATTPAGNSQTVNICNA